MAVSFSSCKRHQKSRPSLCFLQFLLQFILGFAVVFRIPSYFDTSRKKKFEVFSSNGRKYATNGLFHPHKFGLTICGSVLALIKLSSTTEIGPFLTLRNLNGPTNCRLMTSYHSTPPQGSLKVNLLADSINFHFW